MTELTCDKCKKRIEKRIDILTGFKWITINNMHEYDLCVSCYELFKIWLKEGKENEEC